MKLNRAGTTYSIHLASSSIRSLALILAVGLSFGAEARSAAAQGRNSAAQARAQVAAANRAYELGQFEDALNAYSEAYRLKPLPRILFNIAQCHRQLGNYERAAFFYRRYLALSPTPPGNESIVTDLIAEVEAKQAAVERRVRTESDEAKRLELARLESEKADAGRREAEAAARREEETRKQRELDLARQAELARTEQAKAASANTTIYKQWWFWTGVGVVAVGAAAVAYGVSQPKPATLGTIDVR